MRHRFVALVPVVLLALAGVLLVPTSPASASGACVAQGTMFTGPLVYPVTSTGSSVTVTAPRTVGFSMSFSPGACVHQSDGTVTTSGGISAAGTMTGWCGLSSGSAMTNLGGRFTWIGVGGLLVATGDLTGVIAITPNALEGQSCLTGATSWLASNVALTLHCVKTFPHNGSLLLTIPIPTTLTLLLPFIHIHTDPWHIWVKTCLYTPIL